MTLLDEKYLRYLPSVKAAAAVTLALLTVRFAHYCDFANGNIVIIYALSLEKTIISGTTNALRCTN